MMKGKAGDTNSVCQNRQIAEAKNDGLDEGWGKVVKGTLKNPPDGPPGGKSGGTMDLRLPRVGGHGGQASGFSI